MQASLSARLEQAELNLCYAALFIIDCGSLLLLFRSL